MKKVCNIVIAGVGGQGVLTIAGIIARSAMTQGLDIKASELHGLAMRFGSLQVHLRIGKKVHSPMVASGQADIIVSHEPMEAVKATKFANKNTVFLYDTKKQIPSYSYIDKTKYPSLKEINKMLKKFSKHVIPIDASEEAEKLTGNVILSNTFILGRLVAEKVLPLRKEIVLKVLKELVPKKTVKDNVRVFEEGFKR